ncbi:MAG: MATE family efflux transporter [Lachnospiraceae bacterium]|nr:MATE family efflux transporter [Lachnospiraceae bacterium]MDD7177425.1 MATE family efflux transporter [bacterium]MDY5517209.1 MATE family efflux transporter [Lachnospiraceae bacterium]
MGTMSEGRLLLNMSLPMMLSMLVQAMYNVVDSIFVSRIGENALTAVSLAFPLQTLLIALGAGTGVGVNSLLSKALGEKDYEKANKAAMNGIFLFFISYLVSAFIGIVGVRPFYASQIKDAPIEIMDMGIEYLTIVMVASFGLYAQFIFERLLQATGRTFFTMVSQMTGAIINIILDPILIFGYFGLPKMGVAGAAVATIAGQIVGGIIGFIYNIKKNDDITLSFKGFRPDGHIIGTIYKVGFPSIIMQSIGSIMTYGMNLILVGLSATAAAVFGVYFKLQSFFFMPVFGLNNGIIPIVAYNYGAQKKHRMLRTIKWGMLIAFCFLLVGFVVFETIPGTLLLLFDASENMLGIGIPALRIIAVHFLIAWFCIVAGSVFQAVGNGMYSLYVSVARQLVVLLPAAYILAKIGGLDLIWWSFPIAELMSCMISTICLTLTYKKVIRPMPDVE